MFLSITRRIPVNRVDAYKSNILTEHNTGRKGVQYINSPLEPCHELPVVSSKVTESLALRLLF
jgi:hypothetical protein